MRFLLVTTVKNEGPTLLEWVAHHLNVGFTDIVVYQNDSFDNTPKVLRTLQKTGAISYFNNPAHGGRYQNRAYQRAAALAAHDAADWVMALDGDEYLAIHTPEGDLASLVRGVEKAGGEVDTIRVNWKVFGDGGRGDFAEGLVTESFDMAEPADEIAARPVGYKTLYRPAFFGRPGIHYPKRPTGLTPRERNGSGLAPAEFRLLGWRSTDPGLRRLAQVNHYMVRSVSDFVLKADRGSSSKPHREVALKYWRDHNRCEARDRSLADRAAATRATMTQLDRRSHGRLSYLSQNARDLQRARLDELMRDDDFGALREALTAQG